MDHAYKVVRMEKFGTLCFGIGRLLGLAALLLLTPLTASATGAYPHSPALTAPSHSGILGKSQANAFAAATEHHNAPADEPLHCHLKSSPVQAIGPAQATVSDNPLLFTLVNVLTFAGNVKDRSLATGLLIPARAPPRFILFGNFRS